MNDDIPRAKIRMLRSSLLCFVFGLLGLIPLIGLPFAFSALWISGRIRIQEKHFWNAARPYRIWGVVCAVMGAVLGSGILAFVIIRAWMIAQGPG
ncbi:MAG: hypothetical protein ABSA45_00180 [Verrucomicrobiota bacterium]|jgi:uncharacterized membrane protein